LLIRFKGMVNISKPHQSLKVLNVVLGNYPGGTEKSGVDYTYALHELGWLSLCLGSRWVCGQLSDAIPCYRPWISGPPLPWSVWKVRRWIREMHIDAVIIHGGDAADFMSWVRPRVPVFQVAHLPKRYRRLHVDDFILIAKGQRQFFKTGEWLPHALREEVQMLHHTSDLVLGWMGRIEPYKGIDRLIHWVIRYNEKSAHKKIRLRVAGKGTFEKELQAIATPEIDFVGWLKTPEEKKKFWESVSVFAFLSPDEPFGLVTLEAMQVGLPVWGCNTGVLRDLPPSPGVHIIQSDQDLDRLAKNSSAMQRRREGLSNRELFGTLFSWDSFKKGLRHVLTKMLKKHKSSRQRK
jgi:glycosyltransferase involved in cell wall biosynthesis